MSAYLENSRRWVKEWVIGLNLCPFARKPFVQGRVRFVLEESPHRETLLSTLARECLYLNETPSEETETTLIVHPHVLQDFGDYLDFLPVAEELIRQLGLEGVLQVASFHPDYQFQDTDLEAPENYTNRSPYPMLHLIREDSISRALDNWEEPETIPEANIELMNKLGLEEIRKILDATE